MKRDLGEGQGLKRPQFEKILLQGENPGDWTYGRDESGVKTAYREEDGILTVVKETSRQLVIGISGLGLLNYKVVTKSGGPSTVEEHCYELDTLVTESGQTYIPKSAGFTVSWVASPLEHCCSVDKSCGGYGGMKMFFWGALEKGTQPEGDQLPLTVQSYPAEIEI